MGLKDMLGDKTKDMVTGAFRDLVKDVGKAYIERDDLQKQVKFLEEENQEAVRKVQALEKCIRENFPSNLSTSANVFDCAIRLINEFGVSSRAPR